LTSRRTFRDGLRRGRRVPHPQCVGRATLTWIVHTHWLALLLLTSCGRLQAEDAAGSTRSDAEAFADGATNAGADGATNAGADGATNAGVDGATNAGDAALCATPGLNDVPATSYTCRFSASPAGCAGEFCCLPPTYLVQCFSPTDASVGFSLGDTPAWAIYCTALAGSEPDGAIVALGYCCPCE
jgi:hypothetical protein